MFCGLKNLESLPYTYMGRDNGGKICYASLGEN